MMGTYKLYGALYNNEGEREIILIEHFGDDFQGSIKDPYDLSDKVIDLMPIQANGDLNYLTRDNSIWDPEHEFGDDIENKWWLDR